MEEGVTVRGWKRGQGSGRGKGQGGGGKKGQGRGRGQGGGGGGGQVREGEGGKGGGRLGQNTRRAEKIKISGVKPDRRSSSPPFLAHHNIFNVRKSFISYIPNLSVSSCAKI